MVVKNIGATIFLVLFCCIAYAKEGYNIVLCPDKTTTNNYNESKAYLFRSSWSGNQIIDSSFANKKGNITLSGNKNLVPGEYIIKWDGKTVEFFVSNEGYTKIKLQYSGEDLVQKKGSEENHHFIRFQNLISHGWKSLSDAASLQAKIDSTANLISQTAPGSLFSIMLNGQKGNLYLQDNRIANTRFARKYFVDYLKEIEYNSNDFLINKADSLISSAADSVKSLVAIEIFKYFSKPQIMGQESIACHIANKYFLKGTLKCSQPELFEMRTFVMLNGSSLIGMQAQELEMRDTSNNIASLHNLINTGEYTILYFYTDDCVSCRVETPLLTDFVNNYQNGILNVYAVYTQDYEQRWKNYINEKFYIYNPFVNWINVWDPQIESGFHMLYNVISTPQIYLIDKCGAIIGRGLDVKALKELIAVLDYEQENLRLFLETLFSQYKDSSLDVITSVINNLYEKSKEDKKTFKDIFCELYRYLKNSESSNLKEAAVYVAQNYIIGLEEIWEAPQYISKIEKELEQMKKNMPGCLAANIKGEDEAGAPIDLYDIKGEYKIVYFYSTNCSLCTPTTEQLKALYEQCRNNKESNIAFAAINVGSDKTGWKKFVIDRGLEWYNIHASHTESDIYGKYYIEMLPTIYLLDSNNCVIKRNLTISDLKNILQL